MMHPYSMFAPLRSPGIRDWIRDSSAVVLGALLMTATLPGRTHGLGLITKRVIDDLAIDTVTFAQLNFVATILGSLFCWPCGRWLDRFGQTRVATAVLVLLSISLIAMSSAASLPFFAIGLIFTRGLGQSMLSIISLTWIGRWFGTRVGGAMGAFALLMSFMMAAATGLLAGGVNGFGWRNAWSYQAIGILAVLIPLWLLPEPSRHSPHAPSDTAGAPPTAEHAATWQSALRTPCFWVFSLSISFFGLVSSGFTLFSQYVLAERGFGEQVFQTTLILSLLSGMVFNLLAGWLLNRIRYERMLAIGLLILSVSLAMFPWIEQTWHVVLYALLFGAAGGILTVVYFAIWRHAFGAQNLGSIQAAAQIPTVLASALGPVLIAVSESVTGSFLQAFMGTAIMAALFSVVAWFTPVPNASSRLATPGRTPP